MAVKIGSSQAMYVWCDRCDTTLLIVGPNGDVDAELDMGSESVRDAARHGLLCGKTPDELQRLSDALGAVKAAIVAGSGVTG